MSAAEDLHAPVCPACVATPAPRAEPASQSADIILSVPGVHCAGCISTVERALEAVPGVSTARVNLTLKRANVTTDGAEVPAADLIEAVRRAGYEALELDPALIGSEVIDRAGRELLMRLAVAGFAMMNVMLLSVAVWSGAEGATRDFMHWVSALIALPAITFSAQPFFRNAWSALRARSLNMDVPISLAIVLAAGMSLFETMLSGAEAYFDAALSLTFFLLAGRYLDHRTRLAARSAAQELSALETHRAIRLSGEAQETVDVAQLQPGDLILVPPGTRVPTDGVVISGESELDTSHLTGETVPVPVAAAADALAGAINLTGPLTVRVTAAGRDNSLRRMADLVSLAETARNRYTSLADRAARIYAPGVHLLAAAAFVAWLWATGDLRHSLTLAISVLIITCPCALGLAVPAVTTAASGRLFRKGILLKNATALERLAEVDTVVFDKTGTLTEGTPRLVTESLPDARSCAIARALASQSRHPLSQALVAGLDAAAAMSAGPTPDPGTAADTSGPRAAARVADKNAAGRDCLDTPVLQEVREHPGRGIEARLNGETVRLGHADWVGAEALPGTHSWLRVGDAAPVRFDFAETLRPGARKVIAALRGAGIEVHMLTGDSDTAASRVARDLGIDRVLAGARPDGKLAYIEGLQRNGRRVLMVGDGLNDTIALASAHVSAAPASALEAARVAADIVLLGAGLDMLPDTLRLARKARRRIIENFAIAAIYNAIAIPLALAGYATPLMAAIAMSASSITVSLNAMRLR